MPCDSEEGVGYVCVLQIQLTWEGKGSGCLKSTGRPGERNPGKHSGSAFVIAADQPLYKPAIWFMEAQKVVGVRHEGIGESLLSRYQFHPTLSWRFAI